MLGGVDALELEIVLEHLVDQVMERRLGCLRPAEVYCPWSESSVNRVLEASWPRETVDGCKVLSANSGKGNYAGPARPNPSSASLYDRPCACRAVWVPAER